MSQRCAWVSDDPLYIAYHDQEWGVALRDPEQLFELLILEGMQAGLSWITVLRKRTAIKQALADFDIERLAAFTQADIERCLANPNIIRNRLKIQSAVSNAQAYLALQAAGVDFSEFVWHSVNGQCRQNHWPSLQSVPTQTPESLDLSRRLKAAGFKFVGATICYAFMQAAGLVNDHTTDCDWYCQS